MTRSMISLAFAASVIAIAPVSAQPQVRGEITVFSNPNYTGARYTLTGPDDNVIIPFIVRSAQVSPRVNWDLCRQTRYRGCTRVNESSPSMNIYVRSARQMIETAPEPQPGGSLRGMSAEFFVRPTGRFGRIEVPEGSAAAAQDKADRYCKAVGYNYARYQRLETVGGRHYLTDLLCTRS